MYIELYVDSLLLVNFVMNLYLLILINRSTYHTAGRWRMLSGAAGGAVVWLLPFLPWGPAVIRILLSAMVSTFILVCFVFRVRSLKALLRILQKLLWFSFLLGGGVLFLQGAVPVFRENTMGIFGVMGAGGLIFLLAGKRKEQGKEEIRCQVTLVAEQAGIRKTITTWGLIDSGNSLTEPVSGKPVSVIDRAVFDALWEESPSMWRAVPYHSIGKKRGILQAYPIAEACLQPEGMTLICRDIYVAVSPQPIEGMIIHPALLQEKTAAKEKNSKKKTKKVKRQK